MAGFGETFNQVSDPLDLFGGQASRTASKLQLDLGKLGLQIQQEFFNQLRADTEPVRATRNAAIGAIQGLDRGGTLPTDPVLGYQIGQAQDKIRAGAAARGKFNSGGRYMAEQDTVAGLTSQDLSANMNRLLNLAGFETSDLINSNQLLQQNVNQQATQMGNLGAIEASGIMGQQNAFSNMLGNAAGFAGMYASSNRKPQPETQFDYGAPAYNANTYAGYV